MGLVVRECRGSVKALPSLVELVLITAANSVIGA